METQLFRVWLLLSAITVLAWWLGREHVGPSPAVTYGALLIVATKVRIIVSEFMEARHASKTLQHAMDAWLFLLVAALAAIYTFKLDMPAV